MNRSALFLVFTVFLLLTSCEKETILSVDQTSVAFPETGGTQTVSLTANKPWTASSNQSWCKVSPSAGEEVSSSKITITCEPNTTYDARSGSVTFTCAEKTISVNVSQTINKGLLVPQTEYNVSNAAQQLVINVQANVKFGVEVDNGCKDWVKYNSTKGLSNSTIVLDIAKNEAYDGREGKVIIKQIDGNLSATVLIKQGQLDGLFLTTSEYNLSNEKHTLTVEVKSNIDFDVKPEVDWIKYVETKGLKTNQIILDVAANETYDAREGKVIVKQKNGDLSGTVTVRQDENNGILVSQSEYSLTNEAQTIDVEVKYNVDFEIVIPSGCKDWIKQVSTKALNNRTYSFSIAKNETYDNREGSITFKQKKGDISTTVSIKQAQTDYLDVSKTDYIVDIEGETITIEVISNVDFTVSISEDAQSWLSKVETKELSKSVVQISVSPGDEDTDRIGRIAISHGSIMHIVTIHQYSYAANTIITFVDQRLEAQLVSKFDSNRDGLLSIKEAQAVKTIKNAFGNQGNQKYFSFDEFQYFTGVEEVPEKVFSEWTSLKAITLPNSIKKIGSKAFEYCEKLSTIVIPEGVTSLGDNVFLGCSNLTSVSIPEGVTSISTGLFVACKNLHNVSIPKSVRKIGAGAFSGCESLESIMIHEGVTDIGKSAFYNCKSLKEVTIPGSVTNWGQNLFEGCTGLTSVMIEEGVTVIGEYAFSGCRGLTTVKMPESLLRIRDGVFKDCSSLRSITIPHRVTNIGSLAFYGSGLLSVEIPGSVISWDYAFSHCESLESVILHEGIPNIGAGTFMNCIIESIVIPNSVNIIDEAAFYCTKLKSIVIPDSVTEIGTEAFLGCSSMKSVVIPESVSKIGAAAFLNCYVLQSVTINRDIPPTIGECVFYSGGKVYYTLTEFEYDHLELLPNFSIVVPKESVELYKQTWKEYADRIKM